MNRTRMRAVLSSWKFGVGSQASCILGGKLRAQGFICLSMEPEHTPEQRDFVKTRHHHAPTGGRV